MKVGVAEGGNIVVGRPLHFASADFAGKVALITGGAAGIGRATALALAGLGATVVIGDIAVEEGEALVSEITDGGGLVRWRGADQDVNAATKAV